MKLGRRQVVACLLGAVLMWTAAPLFALDHDNLDPNRPIGMEDAYAIPKGEIGLEGGVRFNDRREGRTSVTFQPQIIYGAFANTQIEIQGDLFTDPRSLVGANKSGDLHLGVLYNFNTETLNLPAFAVRVEADLPTGVNSKGVDTQLTGILTRSFGRFRVHLNAGYTVIGSPQGQERPGAYRAVAAVSYPLGYPTSFRDTLIASVYSRQSDLRGQQNHTGVEIGIRHQLTSRVVLDGGLGTEFVGPADRAALLGTVGVSVGF
ncbi:MAG: transporter [Nitrospira sp.]|nr:transporter [Nitrospira sp.]MBP6604566.1 transporter [Nitrospira sp.]HQY58379.1 transporter [Nitrospira sp.]HRA98149.1 transporter [Nitrospira sp.]